MNSNKFLFWWLLTFITIPIWGSLVLFLSVINLLITQKNPFFTQLRAGQYGKVFRILKLRTMRDMLDSSGIPLPDKERITRLGQFLRRNSLDELPSLINVLKGDMTIVGPRPLLVEYLSLYSEEQKKRHNVRPGITGWAQVNGRNAILWEEKFDLDLWYVGNQSFLLDIKILFMTMVSVIRREGISSKGEVTMSKFTGSKK